MERDYPIGHPAACDFNAATYTAPESPYYVDYPQGHPARNGKNVTPLSTQDGMREAQLKQTNQLQDLAKQGCLPPLLDPAKPEPLPVTPEQLAHIYAARRAYDPDKTASEDARQAVGYIIALGYSKPDAINLFLHYAQPPKPASEAKG
jgi:hypothetical protein